MFPGKIFLDDNFQDLNESRDKFDKDLINSVKDSFRLFCILLEENYAGFNSFPFS